MPRPTRLKSPRTFPAAIPPGATTSATFRPPCDAPSVDTSSKCTDTSRPATTHIHSALASSRPLPDCFAPPDTSHFEPATPAARSAMYPAVQNNPVADAKKRELNEYASSPDAKYPYILTTYRLTEHHTAGGMSRTLSHLAELQPEMFAEIS